MNSPSRDHHHCELVHNPDSNVTPLCSEIKEDIPETDLVSIKTLSVQKSDKTEIEISLNSPSVRESNVPIDLSSSLVVAVVPPGSDAWVDLSKNEIKFDRDDSCNFGSLLHPKTQGQQSTTAKITTTSLLTFFSSCYSIPSPFPNLFLELVLLVAFHLCLFVCLFVCLVVNLENQKKTEAPVDQREGTLAVSECHRSALLPDELEPLDLSKDSKLMSLAIDHKEMRMGARHFDAELEEESPWLAKNWPIAADGRQKIPGLLKDHETLDVDVIKSMPASETNTQTTKANESHPDDASVGVQTIIITEPTTKKYAVIKPIPAAFQAGYFAAEYALTTTPLVVPGTSGLPAAGTLLFFVPIYEESTNSWIAHDPTLFDNSLPMGRCIASNNSICSGCPSGVGGTVLPSGVGRTVLPSGVGGTVPPLVCKLRSERGHAHPYCQSNPCDKTKSRFRSFSTCKRRRESRSIKASKKDASSALVTESKVRMVPAVITTVPFPPKKDSSFLPYQSKSKSNKRRRRFDPSISSSTTSIKRFGRIKSFDVTKFFGWIIPDEATPENPNKSEIFLHGQEMKFPLLRGNQLNQDVMINQPVEYYLRLHSNKQHAKAYCVTSLNGEFLLVNNHSITKEPLHAKSLSSTSSTPSSSLSLPPTFSSPSYYPPSSYYHYYSPAVESSPLSSSSSSSFSSTSSSSSSLHRPTSYSPVEMQSTTGSTLPQWAGYSPSNFYSYYYPGSHSSPVTGEIVPIGAPDSAVNSITTVSDPWGWNVYHQQQLARQSWNAYHQQSAPSTVVSSNGYLSTTTM